MSPQILANLLRRLQPTLQSKNHKTISDCGKAPWGLSLPLGLRSVFTTWCVHRVPARDSGDLVTPLVQADIKSARYYATLRASELGPLFTSAYIPWKGFSRTGSGQESTSILIFTDLLRSTFLLNSRTALVNATCGLLNLRHSFYRRYRANMPNSLSYIISRDA